MAVIEIGFGKAVVVRMAMPSGPAKDATGALVALDKIIDADGERIKAEHEMRRVGHGTKIWNEAHDRVEAYLRVSEAWHEVLRAWLVLQVPK
jgi:hypothetical protein